VSKGEGTPPDSNAANLAGGGKVTLDPGPAATPSQ